MPADKALRRIPNSLATFAGREYVAFVRESWDDVLLVAAPLFDPKDCHLVFVDGDLWRWPEKAR